MWVTSPQIIRMIRSIPVSNHTPRALVALRVWKAQDVLSKTIISMAILNTTLLTQTESFDINLPHNSRSSMVIQHGISNWTACLTQIQDPGLDSHRSPCGDKAIPPADQPIIWSTPDLRCGASGAV